jgi:hypothetical protein
MLSRRPRASRRSRVLAAVLIAFVLRAGSCAELIILLLFARAELAVAAGSLAQLRVPNAPTPGPSQGEMPGSYCPLAACSRSCNTLVRDADDSLFCWP